MINAKRIEVYVNLCDVSNALIRQPYGMLLHVLIHERESGKTQCVCVCGGRFFPVRTHTLESWASFEYFNGVCLLLVDYECLCADKLLGNSASRNGDHRAMHIALVYRGTERYACLWKPFLWEPFTESSRSSNLLYLGSIQVYSAGAKASAHEEHTSGGCSSCNCKLNFACLAGILWQFVGTL